MPVDATLAGAGTSSLSPLEVLRIPAMRRLWLAQLVSTFGDFLALFAVISFLTFRLHATPNQITALQLAYLLPIAVLGLVAGAFVDRWPVKPTLVTSDLVRAGLCLLLIPSARLGHFYAVLASISVLSAFFSPAQGVAIRRLVPFEGLRSAQVLMQQVLFGMRVVGPPLAILIFKAFGARISYIADAVSFLASGCLIASAALKGSQAVARAPRRRGIGSVLFDMREGFASVLKNRPVLIAGGAMAISMLAVGCLGSLLAVYVRDVLKASAGTYSAATLMTGVGLFGGANLSGWASRRISDHRQILLGAGLTAFALLLLALDPQLWSLFLADTLIGIAIGSTAVVKDTIIQQQTAPALLGRTSSTMLSIIFSSQIIGLIVSGVLANSIGIRGVFAVAAILPAAFCALAVFAMAKRTRVP